MQEMLDEEDLQDNEKYAKIIQDQAAHDEKTLGVNKMLSSPSAVWEKFSFRYLSWFHSRNNLLSQFNSVHIKEFSLFFILFFFYEIHSFKNLLEIFCRSNS